MMTKSGLKRKLGTGASVLPELANNPFRNKDNFQSRSRRNKLARFFIGKLHGRVLSIGGPCPLNDILERVNGIKIDNTGCVDIDVVWTLEGEYDTILCLDVMEHVFDPLHLMNMMKLVLSDDGCIYIGLLERGKLLWDKGHFHEIDDYRLRLLCKRAFMRVVGKYRYKVWRPLWQYLLGLRPLYRLFREYGVVYKLEV